MEHFEIPKMSIFNGEDMLPPFFRDDPVASHQWLFEMHYANSEFARGVPFRDRFFRPGHLLLQYQFFRGEVTPPFSRWDDPKAEIWWRMEATHYKLYGSYLQRSPFILYFRDWSIDKASGVKGIDLWASKVNPWLDRYLQFAPTSAYPL